MSNITINEQGIMPAVVINQQDIIAAADSGIGMDISIRRNNGDSENTTHDDPVFHVHFEYEKDGSLYIQVFEWANDDMCIENHYPEYFPAE